MAELEEQGNLVAEIEVGGPISFQTRMDDIISPEEEDDTLIDDKKPVVQISTEPEPEPTPPVVDEEEEEEEEEPPVETVTPPIDEQYAEYSEAALVGVQLAKSRPDIFGEEIDKKMDWKQLISQLDGYVAKTLDSGREHILEQTAQYKDFIDFLMKGGDPAVLKDAINDGQYADLDLENATEDQLEESVRAMYMDLGLGKDETESLIETHKLSKKLNEKAQASTKHFDKKRKERLANETQQRRAQEQAHAEQVKQLTLSMNKIIDGGNILGMKLTDAEKEQLRSAYFEPTEIRQVPDGKGGTVTRRFTKYQVLEAEFKNDLEKQMAFGKLLLDGFKLDKIKEQGKEERDEDIMDLLNQRHGGNRSRQPARQNAYLFSSDGA